MCTKRGGPIFWIHENHVCPDCNVVSNTNASIGRNSSLESFHPPHRLPSKIITNAAKTFLRANSARQIEQVF